MPIHTFEEYTFDGLTILRKLRMAYCQISHMSPLNPVKSTLGVMWLTHNQIVSIPKDYFCGFTRLAYLDFSYNLLTSVSQLHPLSAILQQLHLDSNKLQNFPTIVHNATYGVLSTLSVQRNILTECRKDMLKNSILYMVDLRSLQRLARLTVSRLSVCIRIKY